MTLTVDSLRAAYNLLPPTLPAGFELRTVAVRIRPARVHAKRRNGGKATYHRRVQKKWVSRWGMVDSTPVKAGEVYKLRDPFSRREVLLVREDDLPRIRAALREVSVGKD